MAARKSKLSPIKSKRFITLDVPTEVVRELLEQQAPAAPTRSHTSLYISKAVMRMLRVIAADIDKRPHDLLVEGVDLVLRKYGKPSIDEIEGHPADRLGDDALASAKEITAMQAKRKSTQPATNVPPRREGEYEGKRCASCGKRDESITKRYFLVRTGDGDRPKPRDPHAPRMRRSKLGLRAPRGHGE
jgi:hypothetical protein